MRRALLLVDHGSRRAEANDRLICVADLTRHLAGPELVVAHAHMELAPPTVAEGFAACAEAGAEHIVVVPYFLFAGRHASEDIPRIAAEAAAAHRGVTYEVAEPLGVHPLIGQVVLERAGVTVGDGRAVAAHCSGQPARCEAPYCSQRR